MIIKSVTLDTIIGLRHKILRPHQTLQDCIYPADHTDGAAHFGAYHNEQLIGIASIYPEARDGTRDAKSWRLRGMAVDVDHQGHGVGRQLVERFMGYVAEHGGQDVWCNARTNACPFYAKLGFNKEGDEFEIPGIGPHYVMFKSVKSAAEEPHTQEQQLSR